MQEEVLPLPQTERLKPVLRKMFVSISFTALLLWPTIWFFQHADLEKFFGKVKFFQLKEIDVKSEWPVTPATAKAWVSELQGRSLLLISPAKVSASLLNHSWVRNVSIKKQYPDELFVEIETKRARAIGIHKGQSYFMDENGKMIEKATNSSFESLDLPFVSFRNEQELAEWPFTEVLTTVESLKKTLGDEVKISELYLGIYPYFRIFLVRPRLEIVFNLENWSEQKEILNAILRNPPSQLGQLHKINLIFPKKAVVSSLLSN